MTELSDRALDVALAEALGYENIEHRKYANGCTKWVYWRSGNPEWGWKEVPEWHASLDAILRDVWPVLEAKGWYRRHLYAVGERTICDLFAEGKHVNAMAGTNEDAAAFSLAALKALKEAKE